MHVRLLSALRGAVERLACVFFLSSRPRSGSSARARVCARASVCARGSERVRERERERVSVRVTVRSDARIGSPRASEGDCSRALRRRARSPWFTVSGSSLGLHSFGAAPSGRGPSSGERSAESGTARFGFGDTFFSVGSDAGGGLVSATGVLQSLGQCCN